jgi:hypothetical protein
MGSGQPPPGRVTVPRVASRMMTSFTPTSLIIAITRDQMGNVIACMGLSQNPAPENNRAPPVGE